MRIGPIRKVEGRLGSMQDMLVREALRLNYSLVADYAETDVGYSIHIICRKRVFGVLGVVSIPTNQHHFRRPFQAHA